MKEFIVYLCILWIITRIGQAAYRDCGSTLATVQSIEVSDCKSDDARCILHRNTNCSIKLQFTLKEDVDKVKAVVHGVIMRVPVDFPLPNSDACVDSNLVCPLKAGQTYMYETELPVLKSYPRITVDVKWQLQKVTEKISVSDEELDVNEDHSNDLLCIMIPSKLE